MELTNNTILITGGTSGIGYEMASQMIDMGNTVIITGRNQAKLDLTQKKLPKIHIYQSDVSDPKAITQLFDQLTKDFPDLNILINNAGEMRKLDLLDKTIDLEDINREVTINLSGPIRMIQQFIPHLITKNNAAIVNVTSGLAFVPFPLSPIYSATKAGLRAYTRALRVQLGTTKIKIFELAAPAVNTPLGDKFAGDMDSSSLMEPAKLVKAAIAGILKDKYEITPGLAFMLKLMSRLAPGLIFNQMKKVAYKSLTQSRNK